MHTLIFCEINSLVTSLLKTLFWRKMLNSRKICVIEKFICTFPHFVILKIVHLNIAILPYRAQNWIILSNMKLIELVTLVMLLLLTTYYHGFCMKWKMVWLFGHQWPKISYWVPIRDHLTFLREYFWHFDF